MCYSGFIVLILQETMHMDGIDFINKVIVVVGLPTIIGACIYVGRKLQVLDDVVKTIDDSIKPSLKDLGRSMGLFETRMTNIEIKAATIEVKVDSLEDKVNSLETKVDNINNNMRPATAAAL